MPITPATENELLQNKSESSKKRINYLTNLNNSINIHADFQQQAPIKNLVLEGGGVKGIAFVGAIKELAEKNQLNDLKAVAGSSAGGITAAMLAIGMDVAKIESTLKATNFSTFLHKSDKPWYDPRKYPEVATQLESLLVDNKHGFSDGTTFLTWFEDLLTAQIGDKDITFKQLHERQQDNPLLKDLKLTGTNITSCEAQIFDHIQTPNMRVADAVRITMSFPGAFAAYEVEIGGKPQLFIDGGVACNFPMHVFDSTDYLPTGVTFDENGQNPATVGILVDSKEEMEKILWGKKQNKQKKLGLFSFFSKIISGLQADGINTKPGQRIIQIYDEEVGTLDFNLSEKNQNKLVASGQNAAATWVENYRGDNILHHYTVYESLTKKYEKKTPAQIKSYADDLITAYEILIKKEVTDQQQQVKEQRSQQMIAELVFLKVTYDINIYGTVIDKIEQQIQQVKNLPEEIADIISKKKSTQYNKEFTYNISPNSEYELKQAAIILSEELSQQISNINKLIELSERHRLLIEQQKNDANYQLQAIKFIKELGETIVLEIEDKKTPQEINTIIATKKQELANKFSDVNYKDFLSESFDGLAETIKQAHLSPEEKTHAKIFARTNRLQQGIEANNDNYNKQTDKLKKEISTLKNDLRNFQKQHQACQNAPNKQKKLEELLKLQIELNNYVVKKTDIFARMFLYTSKLLKPFKRHLPTVSKTAKITIKLANKLIPKRMKRGVSKAVDKITPTHIIYRRKAEKIQQELEDLIRKVIDAPDPLYINQQKIAFKERVSKMLDSKKYSKHREQLQAILDKLEVQTPNLAKRRPRNYNK